MRSHNFRARVAARSAAGIMALAGAAVALDQTEAFAGDQAPVLRSAYGSSLSHGKRHIKPRTHTSHLKIAHHEKLPQTRDISIGTAKSMLVELPRALKDVLVSDPTIVDAVVQTSNRVYLIGKKIGQANAFFFDEYGEQILTLEITVDADGRPLMRLLSRLLPSSNINVEIMSDTVILSGSVRTPAEANTANDIAQRFILGMKSDNDTAPKNKVINLLQVDGEEQVMLRVHIMEVARSVLKQFGVNMSARINSGNFVSSLLTDNALPLTSAAGLGSLPTPGIDANGNLNNFNFGGTSNGNDFFGNSGASSHFRGGGQAVSKALRALERVGLVKTLAEPNLTAVSG
ncbi:MAG: pilus assembly protein N-terminal domain-containing protein, partial [Pseudomonadota bacterium]